MPVAADSCAPLGARSGPSVPPAAPRDRDDPAALMGQIERLRARLRATEAALDHVRSAVFVLDAAALVQFANRPARVLLADGDGLRVFGGRLSAAVNGDAARLRALIAAAAVGGAPAGAPAGPVCAMPIRRRPDRLPLLAAAVPAAAGAHGREVLLFVADPTVQRCAAAELLRDALALTDREASVALATVRRGSLPAAAAELGIALTTARSHLQHVFDKTGTRNQVALAQLIAALGALPDAGA
jgi:DNA-binding CsgD family transcriptional regulator